MNLPQKFEQNARFSLLTYVSKSSVSTIAFHSGTLLLIVVLSGIIVGLCLKPKQVIIRDTQKIIVQKEIKTTDTVYAMKVIPVNKSWFSPTPEKKQKIENKTSGYTKYEKIMWALKTEESFRSKAYPDGPYYSIGFGFNMNPHNKRMLQQQEKTHLIKGWGKGATTTWENSIVLTQIFIDHNITPNLKNQKLTHDQYVAKALKFYNSGSFSLGSCCNGKKGCGNRNKNIRTHHNKRRNFESRLYKGRINDATWDKIRKKAISIEMNHR